MPTSKTKTSVCIFALILLGRENALVRIDMGDQIWIDQISKSDANDKIYNHLDTLTTS